MEELLQQSVSPDVQNTSHFTPLILAAYAGNIDGIKILISKGANINAATLSGNNAVMMAAQNGKTDTVEYLSSIMNAGVNTIRNKTGDTPLMFASKNGHLQTVKLLLKLGAKSDAANSSGMTAIFCAASGGHAEVLKELIMNCGNHKQLLQSQDVNGNTPLHFASYGGHIKAVELLLEHGASPFIKNRHDKTPLMDVTEALPKFTDAQLIQNVNTCRSLLMQKCKELEELSQKHMDDLTKLDNPDPPKKQSKQKTKHKKTKSASQPPQDKGTENESKNELLEKENDPKQESSIVEPNSKPPKDERKSKSEPPTKANDDSEAPSKPPKPQTKTLPLDIPNTQTQPTGKSPTTGKSPVELYSTIVKLTPPSTSTITNIPTQTKLHTKLPAPPGINMLASQPPNSKTNIPTTTTRPSPTTVPLSTNMPASKDTQSTFTSTISSPSKPNPNSTTDTTILDQALSCINLIDPTQSPGHALEVAYRDYNDMCTAITTIHPNAAALDLPVKAIVGIGLGELSMGQLGVLEEIHHRMLQAITDAKVYLLHLVLTIISLNE
eukprot:Phypoly_transcript_05805.p1 GENE.Phypoly_transcript_05805~~Phypoly_transcript_05805.p1  ORF type:complete len:587 (+),score=87.92 Phypoly_transcript_05805:107-1762(+)